MIVWYVDDGYHERVTSLATKAFDICKEYIEEKAVMMILLNRLDEREKEEWIKEKNDELYEDFMRSNDYFEVKEVCRAVALEVEE